MYGVIAQQVRRESTERTGRRKAEVLKIIKTATEKSRRSIDDLCDFVSGRKVMKPFGFARLKRNRRAEIAACGSKAYHD